jgi:hypothetical protein
MNGVFIDSSVFLDFLEGKENRGATGKIQDA